MPNQPALSRRRALRTLFCSSAALGLNLHPEAQAQQSSASLDLLAIGDFGTGAADQRSVAAAMAAFCRSSGVKPAALLLLGDNFYSSRSEPFTVNAKRWRSDIEDMYPASDFACPMPAILGNHDYHDNAGGEKVQLQYGKSGRRWHMPAKWYRMDLGGAKPLLTLLFVDSNFPQVSGGMDKKKAAPRASLNAAEVEQQQQWLEEQLAGPRGVFTVVAGHHPLYSNGSHGDTPALIKAWDSLFEKARVHAYLCGHDHDLQHLELQDRFTSHVLSGGGGAGIRALKGAAKRAMPYGLATHGFSHLALRPDSLVISHHDTAGSLLHRFTKRADGRVEMI